MLVTFLTRINYSISVVNAVSAVFIYSGYAVVYKFDRGRKKLSGNKLSVFSLVQLVVVGTAG